MFRTIRRSAWLGHDRRRRPAGGEAQRIPRARCRPAAAARSALHRCRPRRRDTGSANGLNPVGGLGHVLAWSDEPTDSGGATYDRWRPEHQQARVTDAPSLI